jgi:hypothetical protein
VTRTALLDRCSEQEYEAVGTDGCPAAEVRDHCGFGDGPGGGVRESGVADLPVPHEVVQCGDGFFDLCVLAGVVQPVQVDVVRAETREASLELSGR